VLFKRRFHAGLADGSITLTYRAWSRPQVKRGGRYRVGAIGLIEVDAVDRVKLRSIRAAEAQKAGLASRAELLDVLRAAARDGLPDDAEVFRVRLHHAGPDDRPGPPALAKRARRETQPFKTDVRKLRRLGLTLSFDVGYELAPRGRAFLQRTRRRRV
jgi:hypothetical protein